MSVHIARGGEGAVAAGHELATQEAIAILKSGGNAVDAAVGAALVLTVVCPHAVTLAGDAYAMVFDPRTGKVAGLNGTRGALAAATPDRFEKGMPQRGPLSASIPGLLAGLHDLLARFGTRDLKDLIRPAIRYAADGFPVYPYFAAQIRDRQELIVQDAAARALFLPGDAPPKSGDPFVQPRLAEALKAVAAAGAQTFYRGELARSVAAGVVKTGGIWSDDDLAAHESLWQEPMSAPFYGYDVATMPPNSYGPTLLLQLLELQRGGIDKVAPDGADFVTRGFEARRRAYKAAAKFIGEPTLLEAPMRRLLQAVIDNGGDVERATAGGAKPPEAKDRCTTNVIVVDKSGMAVSLIESISAPFGAGIVLEDTGILLNNRMAGFSADPTSGNCIAPRKRPAHTLAPCIVTRGGKLAYAIGTPGTVGQPCVLAQYLARVLACGQDDEAACAAPRWSADFQGKPVIEDTMDERVRGEVTVVLPDAKPMRRGWITFGSVKLVRPDGGNLLAVADDRRSAAAAAY